MNRGATSFYFRSGNMIVIVEVLLLDGENDCSYIYDLRTLKACILHQEQYLRKRLFVYLRFTNNFINSIPQVGLISWMLIVRIFTIYE